MDGAAEIGHALDAAARGFDESWDSIRGARTRADDAHQLFLGLGGSAWMAEEISDRVDDIANLLEDLQAVPGEAVAILSEVGPDRRPEENVARLDGLISRVSAMLDTVQHLMQLCEDADAEAQISLRGSSAAREIAAALSEARDDLERAAASLVSARGLAELQRTAYQEGRGVAVKVTIVPADPGLRTDDPVVFEQIPSLGDLRRTRLGLGKLREFLRESLDKVEDLSGAAGTGARDAALALGDLRGGASPPADPTSTGSVEPLPRTESIPQSSPPVGDLASTAVVVGVVAARAVGFAYDKIASGIGNLKRRPRRNRPDGE